MSAVISHDQSDTDPVAMRCTVLAVLIHLHAALCEAVCARALASTRPLSGRYPGTVWRRPVFQQPKATVAQRYGVALLANLPNDCLSVPCAAIFGNICPAKLMQHRPSSCRAVRTLEKALHWYRHRHYDDGELTECIREFSRRSVGVSALRWPNEGVFTGMPPQTHTSAEAYNLNN